MTSKAKRVRLADIAKECGTSINTVSHALRDKPDISEKLKKEIRRTAKRMGYIHNASASLLRGGQSKTLSIIVGDISNPHFAIMIKEIENSAREEGYTAFVINSNENESIEYDAIVASISKNVDGILLCPVQKSDRNVRFLMESGVPFTLFGRYFPSLDTNYVVCDDYHSGTLAAEYILKSNQKIAVVMAEEYISGSKERLAGIRDYCQEHGYRLKDRDVFHIRASGDNAEVLKKLSRSNYDGMICFSDLVALELLSYNDKISIVSFDNIMSKFPMPYRFQSITSSKTKMGQKAFEILMESIHAETGNQHIVLPTKLS